MLLKHPTSGKWLYTTFNTTNIVATMLIYKHEGYKNKLCCPQERWTLGWDTPPFCCYCPNVVYSVNYQVAQPGGPTRWQGITLRTCCWNIQLLENDFIQLSPTTHNVAAMPILKNEVYKKQTLLFTGTLNPGMRHTTILLWLSKYCVFSELPGGPTRWWGITLRTVCWNIQLLEIDFIQPSPITNIVATMQV